jgi:hypothetical protein
MSPDPVTDHDWMVHSINIHGVFFERWCQTVISNTHGWSVKTTNYPVSFPLVGGQESALDIYAEIYSYSRRIIVPIECKKNNPEFVNWVFFPRRRRHPSSTNKYVFHRLTNTPASDGWRPDHWFAEALSELTVADEAREIRSSYAEYKGGSKTKTSNTAITDAARQITLATLSIVEEESQRSQFLANLTPRQDMPFNQNIYIPTIVTTAHLLVCTFDPANVDRTTGEIDFADASFDERSIIVYEYPIPRALQVRQGTLTESEFTIDPEVIVRMPIIVINSDHLETIMTDFPNRVGLI